VLPLQPDMQQRTSTLSPAHQFAQALMSRYHRHHQLLGHTESIFQQLRAAVTLYSVSQHREIRVAPQVSVTVQLAHRIPDTPVTIRFAQPSASMGSADERLMARSRFARPLERDEIQEIVSRLIHRGVRLEDIAVGTAVAPYHATLQTMSSASGPSVPRPFSLPVVPPVAMDVRRPVVSPAEARPVITETRGATGEAWPVAKPEARPAQGVNLGPMEIKHLTDQVVQAIDRRMLVAHERIGRM
jgi:hypothetical protein